jgi:hypothetical protein
MILEEISHQKHCGWALCAAVCKEWQVVIERENFCRLTIQESCLKELEHIVIRQRSLVRYICLDIKLPRYACRSCQQSSSMACISKYSSLVRDAIVKLFSILQGWQPTGHLILELSAFSPSDSEHWFKTIILDLDTKILRIGPRSGGMTQVTAGLMANRLRLLAHQLY